MDRIRDAATDDVEVALDLVIDSFGEHLLNGELKEIVTEVPILKNVGAVVSIVGIVRNYAIARKISVFVETLRKNEPDLVLYDKLSKKYKDKRILEEVLLQIDRFSKESHAQVYAFLFQALLKEKITWQEFCSLGFSLERLDPQALNEKLYFHAKPGEPLHQPSVRFVSAGLAYTQTVLGGTKSIMMPLGAKFWEYGMAPYQSLHHTP